VEIAAHDLHVPMLFPSDFPRFVERAENTYYRFPGFPQTAISSVLCSSPRCYAVSRNRSKSFGLLHASGFVCIADGCGDSIQRIHTQSIAQVLCWFVQQRQGFQRGLCRL
jgi:hypothetical protein